MLLKNLPDFTKLQQRPDWEFVLRPFPRVCRDTELLSLPSKEKVCAEARQMSLLKEHSGRLSFDVLSKTAQELPSGGSPPVHRSLLPENRDRKSVNMSAINFIGTKIHK